MDRGSLVVLRSGQQRDQVKHAGGTGWRGEVAAAGGTGGLGEGPASHGRWRRCCRRSHQQRLNRPYRYSGTTCDAHSPLTASEKSVQTTTETDTQPNNQEASNDQLRPGRSRHVNPSRSERAETDCLFRSFRRSPWRSRRWIAVGALRTTRWTKQVSGSRWHATCGTCSRTTAASPPRSTGARLPDHGSHPRPQTPARPDRI